MDSPSRSGRWRTAALVTWLVAASTLAAVELTWAATYVVTSTADNVAAGTLRWAIQQANANAGFDRINFNIPGTGVRTITLTDELYITDSVDINARSQPGYAGRPLIHINVNRRNQAFFLASTFITIQGFIINNHASNGITIWPGANTNWIQFNWIGFDANGQTDSTGYEPRGIGIQSNTNTVRWNVVSGVGNGITIGYDPSLTSWQTVFGNSISENIIGLDPTGSFAIPNESDGIFLGAGATRNWIGPGNVVSGNLSAGVELMHKTTSWNVVFSNSIGLNGDGTAAIPNGELAVLVSNGSNQNAIGGPWGGNWISGNHSGIAVGDVIVNGVVLWASGWGNWIQNNWIGLDEGGAAEGNALVGIHIRGLTSHLNNVSGNVIVANSWWGILLENTTANWIDFNYIGVTPSGVAMGNGRDGVLLDNSTANVVINNVIKNNGWAPGFAWKQIRETNGSRGNTIAPNTF
jgi:hypothetical protein